MHLNYDAPEIFEHDALLADVKSLSAGIPITRKGYDYENHRRADRPNELIMPPDTLIIEGIHTFYDARLVDMMDLKVYIRVDPDICLLRRIKRDMQERGRDLNGIESQYLLTVKPMYEKYVRGYSEFADIIVTNGGKNPKVSDMLAAYIISKTDTTKKEP